MAMRRFRTFVLHLLVDPSAPLALRGEVQAIPDPHCHAFGDGDSLLNLLQDLSNPGLAAKTRVLTTEVQPEPASCTLTQEDRHMPD